MLRASLLLLLAPPGAVAYDVEDATRPTEDPEEIGLVLMDEYSEAGISAAAYRSLLLLNETPGFNTTAPTVVMPEPVKTEVPWVPIAGVALVIAAGGVYYMTRPSYEYETYDMEYGADEEGLIEEYEEEEYEDE
jgi:hypothetical protein